ncbi:MAG: CarboxypepD reg-like protein [Mucilaginibacter sp.]|nr:CarboxypepD reg-like protein [Mucilaginibacter sp.]
MKILECNIDLFMRLFLLFLLLIPVCCFAQFTVTGKVIDGETKGPVMDASVFLSNSSVGTKTINDGIFALKNVKSGKYDLVVSCVGYQTFHKDITIYNTDINLPAIEINIKVNMLVEVKVKATKKGPDAKRARYLRIFTREFFGRTKNAGECSLLNQEKLNFIFDENSEKLTATSSDFLIIENKGLGYRIKYLLDSFLSDPRGNIAAYKGSFYFEPLKGTPEQEAQWQKERADTYHGSAMHFFRSCIANEVEDNGFTVRKLVRTETPGRAPDSLINVKLKMFRISSGVSGASTDSLRYWAKMAKRPRYEQEVVDKPLKSYEYTGVTNQKGIYAFFYHPDWLMINYKHKANGSNNTTTFVDFVDQFAYFDSNGVIFTPESFIVEGFWGTKRVGELLPVDYELPYGM